MEVPDYGRYEHMDWPDAEKGMAAMVTRMDADIGRLLDRLEEYGIAENTFVFFTSDNGPHRAEGAIRSIFDSNGPLRGFKRDLYEGGIRVPTIAWWPGSVEAATVTDHVGYFADMLPTFAGLAGGCSPGRYRRDRHDADAAGPSGRSARTRISVLGVLRGRHGAGRTDRFVKGVRMPVRDAIEVYDLDADVSETTDLAAQHPDVVARLDSIMQAAHRPSSIQWTRR